MTDVTFVEDSGGSCTKSSGESSSDGERSGAVGPENSCCVAWSLGKLICASQICWPPGLDWHVLQIVKRLANI